MRRTHRVWIDDGCDVCLANNVFGVLLRGPSLCPDGGGMSRQRSSVLCLDCIMAVTDGAARHPGGRPDRTSRELRAQPDPPAEKN